MKHKNIPLILLILFSAVTYNLYAQQKYWNEHTQLTMAFPIGGGVINRVIMTSDSKGFEKLYPRVLNYLKVEKKNKNEEHEISVSIIMHIVRV